MHYILIPVTPLWKITEHLLHTLYTPQSTESGLYYCLRRPHYPYPSGFYAYDRDLQIKVHNDQVRYEKALSGKFRFEKALPPLPSEALQMQEDSENEDEKPLPAIKIKEAAWEACGQVLFSGIEARSRRNSRNRRSDNGEPAHGNFI